MSLRTATEPAAALEDVRTAAGAPHPVRTSDVLRAFRDRLPEGRVSLADLIDALGDRSLGTILLALALPTVAPVPLGVSCLFDLPILLFSLRMLTSASGPSLPPWLLRRSVSRNLARRMIDAALPRLAWIERMLAPRLPRVVTVERKRWFGALLFVLTVMCIVPLPLTGWLPGFALVLLSLGLIERDGGAIAVGFGLAVASVVFMALVISGLSYAGTELLGVTTTP
ncbi:exopolysaccharide biosynthesis protein [Azospirillum sp. SYSU D00513]|uniref:exopolysaccharide biosynthesis protein n=1 Tax=Azospirillum sp. SYSU D00513 TaxID=2812561 RepID=UPI001A9695EF|nr:exopolysaccharide biosynthesis protein [Azospirillum sp. SYSU D00513]